MAAEPAADPGRGIAYRPDVDGLRAVAILGVVLFHAHVPGFGGGFAGVDVFFVISGYLIAQWVGVLSAARSDWAAEFFRRRFLRLFPAMVVVLAATAVAAAVLLLPEDLDRYARSLRATAAWAANLFFWGQAGYFAPPARTEPLLHMWSLAVEQHFYVAYPLGLALLLRLDLRRHWLAAIAIVAACSLAASVWAMWSGMRGAFFLTPLRFWELLLGSMIAVHRPDALPVRWNREVAGWAGLGLIGISMIAFHSGTPWPGVAALVPCAGAALLVWNGSGNAPSSANQLLATRLPVALGLISYSLYLWHWPVLAFGRYQAQEELGGAATAGLVALSLGLAVITWRWVEQPARRLSKHVGQARALAWLCAFVAACTAIAFLVDSSGGWSARYPQYAQAQAALEDRYPSACAFQRQQGIDVQACRLGVAGAATRDFLLWGDSHAKALAPAFDALARDAGRAGLLATLPGCIPLVGAGDLHQPPSPECEDLNEAALAQLRPGMTVFIHAYWTRHESGSFLGDDGRAQPQRVLEEGRTHRVANRAVIGHALGVTLGRITQVGARAVVLGPLPNFSGRIPSMLLRFPERTQVARSVIDERAAPVSAVLRAAASRNGAAFVDLMPGLCDQAACRGVAGGKILYYDDNHLTVTGALQLAGLLRPSFAP